MPVDLVLRMSAHLLQMACLSLFLPLPCHGQSDLSLPSCTESGAKIAIERELTDVSDGLGLLQQKRDYLLHDPAGTHSVGDSTCSTKFVINLGLPRTGTMSMASFMEALGYNTHHGFYSTELSDSELMDDLANHRLSTDGFQPKHFSAIWPDEEGPLALVASPWTYFSCEFFTIQPWSNQKHVKFTLMERSPESWYGSVLTMFCSYGGHTKCQQHIEGSDHEYFFLRTVMRPHMCSRAAAYSSTTEFCDSVIRDPVSTASADKTGLKLMTHFMQNHTARVQSCVPSDDLLVVNLDDPTKADKISEHLGCRGPTPIFPDKVSIGHTLYHTGDQLEA